MRKLISILFILLSTNAFPQASNLIFNTNSTEHKFQVFINGKLQSSSFDQNVRLENLEAKNYRIKVVFENSVYGFIQRDLYIRPNTEKIYSFKRRKKATGRRPTKQKQQNSPLVLDLLSETPLFSIDDEFMGDANDTDDAINYTTTESPKINNNTNTDFNIEYNTENYDADEETSSNNLVIKEEETSSCTPSYTDDEFLLLIVSIEQEGFESKKLEIAKGISDQNCLLTKQVRDVIKLFNFENNRVEFAKFAYKSVADKENYDLLLDSFKFETSKQEIRKYINN